MELQTLHTILFDNRQLRASIKNRIGVAKDAHGRIQIRYDQLLRELDGIKSELDVSHSYLVMLEKQEEDLQARDQELQVLLHPIRRCPEDILVLVFDLAVDEKSDGRLRRATTLSSVCKSWRALALKTSRFWSQVVVSMKDDTEALESFSSRTRVRLRSHPADVTIKDINRHYNEFWQILQLDKFKSIEKLHYLLESPNDLNALKGLVPRAISDTVSILGIEAGPYLQVPNDWRCENFFNAFPRLRSLNLIRTGWHALEGLDPLDSLRSITLNEVAMPSFTLDLPELSGLEALEIKGDSFELGDLEEDVSLPLLHTLTILDAKNFPWKKVTAPRLRKLVTDDWDDDIVNFCCRHLSLRELALKTFIGEEGFARISNALGELEMLEIVGIFDLFYYKEITGTPFLPFSKLHHLTVDACGFFCIDYDRMGSFIRSRCISLPSAESDNRPRMLESLDIIDHEGHLEDADWRDHPSLQSCTQTLTWEEDMLGRLQLRWRR